MFSVSVKLFSLTLLACAGQSDPDENFSIWLGNAMQNYSGWVRANNFNPPPVRLASMNMNVQNIVVDMDVEIRNFFVRNFAENVEGIEVMASLTENVIQIDFYTAAGGQIEFEGDYFANGTLITEAYIGGSGHWMMNFDRITHRALFYNFTVTDQGYISLRGDTQSFQYTVTPTTMIEVDFEDLFGEESAGFAEPIKTALVDKFQNTVKENRSFPAAGVLYWYLNELFQKTPVAEIIGQH